MISVIVVLVIVGVGLWCINTYLPMAPPIKMILNVVVILCIVLWLLSAFGVMDSLPGPRHPLRP